jgi:hypothetical protein
MVAVKTLMLGVHTASAPFSVIENTNLQFALVFARIIRYNVSK